MSCADYEWEATKGKRGIRNTLKERDRSAVISPIPLLLAIESIPLFRMLMCVMFERIFISLALRWRGMPTLHWLCIPWLGLALQCGATNPVENSLGKPTQVEVTYDADGNRVAEEVVLWEEASGTYQTNRCRWLRDDLDPSGFSQIVARISSGHTAAAWMHGLGPEAEWSFDAEDGNRATWLFKDGQGSVRQRVASTEGVMSDATSRLPVCDAFGISLTRQSEFPSGPGYRGEFWDPELGAYDLRARWYSPEMGRFQSVDSFEGQVAVPGTHHAYAYALQDPINRIDPSGHESLLSVNASVAMISQLSTHELRGAGAALKGVREIYGGDDDLNGLIYGIDVATLVDEKLGQLAMGVTAVMGGVKLVGLAGEYLASQGPLRFSQISAFWEFQPKGPLGGKTIGAVAQQLRAGVLNVSQVPVRYIVRKVDGKQIRLIVNTRSSLSLKRAGIPESRWNLINVSGDVEVEKVITKRLKDNGLNDAGTEVLRIGTRDAVENHSRLD